MDGGRWSERRTATWSINLDGSFVADHELLGISCKIGRCKLDWADWRLGCNTAVGLERLKFELSNVMLMSLMAN